MVKTEKNVIDVLNQREKKIRLLVNKLQILHFVQIRNRK